MRFLGVELADVSVPGCVAVADAHGAVHAADGDYGAGFQGGGVVAQSGGRLCFCAGGLGLCGGWGGC